MRSPVSIVETYAVFLTFNLKYCLKFFMGVRSPLKIPKAMLKPVELVIFPSLSVVLWTVSIMFFVSKKLGIIY